MSEKYLFVGGPADGQRVEAGFPQHVVKAAGRCPRSQFLAEFIGYEFIADEHVYIADRFIAGNFSTLVYRHSSLSGEDAFRMILENYRPAKSLTAEPPRASSEVPRSTSP